MTLGKEGKGEMTKVFIGVPMTGWIRHELARSIVAMTHNGKYLIELLFSHDRPTSSNCNRIIRQFLEGDADHLLLMASDTVPYSSPLDLVELDLDIVAMACPIWRPSGSPPIVMNATPVDGRKTVNLDDGLIEVTQASASVMLMARRVLEHPDLKNPFAYGYDEDGEKTASDDIVFFRKAREAGFKVWVSMDHLCGHVKEIDIAGMYNMVGKWR